MTFTMDQFVVASLIMVFLLGLLIMIPTSSRRGRQRRPRKEKERQEEEPKDWQGVSLKLERVVLSLRREIADLTKQQRVLERDLLIEQEKYAKLKDKLSQERGWQKKEVSGLEKKTQEVLRLRTDLRQAEQSFAHEHTQCLRLSQEAKDTAAVLAALQDEKRRLETRLLTCEARIETDRDELASLRARNDKLSRQHEDTMWVAKSDVVELERRLKEARDELARYKKTAGPGPSSPENPAGHGPGS